METSVIGNSCTGDFNQTVIPVHKIRFASNTAIFNTSLHSKVSDIRNDFNKPSSMVVTPSGIGIGEDGIGLSPSVTGFVTGKRSHGVKSFFYGRTIREVDPPERIHLERSMEILKSFNPSWYLVFAAALFESYAAFVVKSRFNELGKINYSSFGSVVEYLIPFVKSPLLLSAVMFYVLAPAMWFWALSRLDLSSAYPILVAAHLFFVLLFGVCFLGEGLTPNKMFGTLLLVVSIYFFYR